MEVPESLSAFRCRRLMDRDEGETALWRVEDSNAILSALAASELAVVKGQLWELADGEAAPLQVEFEGSLPSWWLLTDPSSWACHRVSGEAWPAFAHRSAGEARQAIREMLTAAGRVLTSDVLVKLEWISRDQAGQFTLPPALVAEIAERMQRDAPPWEPIFDAAAPLVRFAIPGSLAGGPRGRLGYVPPEAEYLSLDARRADLTILERLQALLVLELHQVTPRVLGSLPKLPSLRMLRLVEVRARDLRALARLPGLQALWASPTSPNLDLSPLADLPELRALTIHSRAIGPSSGLERLTQLRCLELLTGGPGAKARVPTLEPLSRLRKLRHLSLGYLKVDDNSLRPLHALRRLHHLEVYSSFPMDEAAALAVALPDVEPDLRSPFRALSGMQSMQLVHACRRCGTLKALTRTQPARRLCPKCSAAKARAYVAEWELALARHPDGSRV